MISAVYGKNVIQVDFSNAQSGDTYTMPEQRHVKSVLLTNVADDDYVTIREAVDTTPKVCVLRGQQGCLIGGYTRLRINYNECSLAAPSTAVLSIILG